MPGIEIKGRSKIANYRHGGRTRKFGGGRTNLLEQLGRVEAEPSNPNRRAEISRVHGELNRGYAKGGRAGFKHGSKSKPWGTGPKPGTLEFLQTHTQTPKRKSKAIGGAIKKVIQGGKKIISKIKGKGKGEKGLGSGIKPSEMHEIIPKGDRKLYLKEKLANPHKRIGKAEGGRIGLKHGFQILGGGVKGKPHSTREGRDAAGRRVWERVVKKGFPKRPSRKWQPRTKS